MHLENADADLPVADSHFARLGGAFVVLEHGANIVGCHAVKPLNVADKVLTFRRLYLSQECRGTGQGTALMEWAITWATTAGWRRIEFWSDTRFTRAHRFFEKFGFQRDGRIRKMHDSFEPYQEHGYFLDLPRDTQ